MEKNDRPLKVLMALMYMDIGGAETHVLELCKALCRRGIDLYVVSNGGAYETELLESGIKHFKVPLHSKNAINMLKSYNFLKKIIVENDIKLVHAHARIPGFLCGLLQKRLKFRFVTTVHGAYNTALLYRALTDWGEKTLAVSEDLKQYLINNYKTPEKNIFMTVNGIDTVKFSKNTKADNHDCAGLCGGLGILLETRKIVNLSRMDNDMTEPTYALIDMAEELNDRFGNIDIIIVGGGNDFENVCLRANEANSKIGKKMIHITGSRTDAVRFFALADMFVGVSRSALEAMSAETPVILAGNQGYLGIFDEKTLDAGIATNFCCRGCGSLTKELIYNDIVTLLTAPEGERERLGKFGRDIIIKNYSAERMADDAIALYNKMRKPDKPVDVVISGYYGSKNHGDDALLKAITDDLRSLQPDLRIIVLSLRPNETKEQYGVESIHRFNFPKIYAVLRKTNLLLVGGGTLVQDLTSSQSLFYYLFIINLALKRGARVMLYANGIGPVGKPRNQKLAEKTLNKVNLLTLRDDASLGVLRQLGVKNENVITTADAAFSIKNTDTLKGGAMMKELGLNNKKFICVAVRSWKFLKEGFEQDIISLLDYITEKYGYTVLFIPMQKSYDYDISKRIISGMKKGGVILERDFSMNEILGVMQNAEFLIGMRLHTIIYAAKTGTPVIGLVYDPKVRGMMEVFGQKYYEDVTDLSVNKLCGYADEIIAHKTEISRTLAACANALEVQAFKNAEHAVRLMDENVF